MAKYSKGNDFEDNYDSDEQPAKGTFWEQPKGIKPVTIKPPPTIKPVSIVKPPGVSSTVAP